MLDLFDRHGRLPIAWLPPDERGHQALFEATADFLVGEVRVELQVLPGAADRPCSIELWTDGCLLAWTFPLLVRQTAHVTFRFELPVTIRRGGIYGLRVASKGSPETAGGGAARE